MDVDQFRQLLETLRLKGILYNALTRYETGRAFRAVSSKRELGRFAIRPPDQTEQFRKELFSVLQGLGERTRLSNLNLKEITSHLSRSSPYKDKIIPVLKLFGLVDERLRPLPSLASLWEKGQGRTPRYQPVAAPVRTSVKVGRITKLKQEEGYGFIGVKGEANYFFHIRDLVRRAQWDMLEVGTRVEFEQGIRNIPGKSPPARNVIVQANKTRRRMG